MASTDLIAAAFEPVAAASGAFVRTHTSTSIGAAPGSGGGAQLHARPRSSESGQGAAGATPAAPAKLRLQPRQRVSNSNSVSAISPQGGDAQVALLEPSHHPHHPASMSFGQMIPDQVRGAAPLL